MCMTQESKGASHYSAKYPVPKLLERVFDARIRRRVEYDYGENSSSSGRGE